ncbi:MAG: DUF599 family protein [Proteobacteria bacterium]|nr:DUF599 family protein [Pseudomonadota bacterium]
MKEYDYWVLGIYFLAYVGYQLLYVVLSNSRKWMTRERIIAQYRAQWYRNVLRAKNQILAIQTIRNLEMVSTFLSSVTLLMMGGVISIFTANPEWMAALETGSYAEFLEHHGIAVKLLVALLMLAIARIGAPLAAQVGMVGPMSTLLMGYAILGEPMNAWIALGTLLVLGGVFLVGRR